MMRRSFFKPGKEEQQRVSEFVSILVLGSVAVQRARNDNHKGHPFGSVQGWLRCTKGAQKLGVFVILRVVS
jgi:hypothetical protein